MKNSAVARPSARLLALGVVALALACTGPELPPPRQECAPGTRCLAVDVNGQEGAGGTYRAQCAGTFPDYIVPATLFPAGYAGPWFSLAQDFPKEPVPAPADLPWSKIDFKKGKAEADAYLYALRDYSFDGMIEADFIPAKNARRRWYHAPLMNYHRGRELVRGLTQERPLRGPELGIKQGTTVNNYAVGFYSDIGAYTFGQVFAQPNDPDLTKADFPEGSMVFKILFSAATPDDFDDPSTYLLERAPAWHIATQDEPETPGKLTSVRLLQMDVAVRDDRAQPSGWVFGTFAFDRHATDEPAWNRLRPVGLMWGNDPGYTPADQKKRKPLRESIVSDQIPAYAKGHLGWAGRVNGPVDNPDSACMSCHQTAQSPAAEALAPPPGCTDEQRLYWFRNLAKGEAFGAVKGCAPDPSPEPPKPVSLDLSLQLAAGVQAMGPRLAKVNPCTPATTIRAAPAGPVTERPIER
jgi:hypothetical protein